ncbi:hypothetical protein [Pseudomonas boanensis]
MSAPASSQEVQRGRGTGTEKRLDPALHEKIDRYLWIHIFR